MPEPPITPSLVTAMILLARIKLKTPVSYTSISFSSTKRRFDSEKQYALISLVPKYVESEAC
jgi:hypothetical protein